MLKALLQQPVAPQYQSIVMQARAPRVLLGAVVGAGLGVVGMALQALVRNPLADPFLLGCRRVRPSEQWP